jgi:indolepyruvate ferredoxin oxidoreductase
MSAAIKLEDKYEATGGRIYVTGPQTLVRIPIDQARSDAAQGMRTAGFISGYRGSPLGTYDLALWQAEKHLKQHRIHFEPGINEDLAATAVWGTQQTPLLGGAHQEGVFALWYGKGPGVDRSADAIKHGNFAGTSAKGGVLLLCGDDHGARSSTLAHQSDHALIHCGVPFLNPANLQEYLDFGLFGLALSRYSGCWIGFKCVTDIIDGSASIEVDPQRLRIELPTDYTPPPDGLSIRFELAALTAEARVFEQRHLAAQAFVRANRLDGQRFGARGRKRLGIVSSGKSWSDLIEALDQLGIGAAEAERLGIGAYKVAMVWPLEPERLKAFAAECDELLVIEEKRGVIEEQIARILFNLPADRRPRLSGKFDPSGRALVCQVGELGQREIMRSIVARHAAAGESSELRHRLDVALASGERTGKPAAIVARQAAFCAGCPHNTSTRVPDGSVAMAGIGCHGMAVMLPDRATLGGYHMGGEGAAWIGQAPFIDRPHVFQNIGDGTYFHSGLLAIRACVAAKVNITYKILLNGAVGMTGGQPIEGEQFAGEITAPKIAQQVHSEGVGRIAVVTEDLEKYQSRSEFPAITTFHHRDELDAVQRELREWQGTSVLIYDQACATERRRLRKRGKLPDTNVRLYINPQVCEGCGDCGVQSNCIAIEPLDTEFGRKRRINQSACNKDQSCLKGFCPSFVSVIGGSLAAPRQDDSPWTAWLDQSGEQQPDRPLLERRYSVLVTGIGGSGVVTVGAILGMAAHLEGRSCSVLDMSGFAQRNGSVMSHIRFAPSHETERSARIPAGCADVVLGCDPIVAASPDSIDMMAPNRAAVIVNRFVAPTVAFAADPDFRVDEGQLENQIGQRVGLDRVTGIDATGIVQKLIGDVLGVNMFLVGFAWQRALIPLERQSIEAAIRLNGAAVDMNLKAFALGRAAAARPSMLARLLSEKDAAPADAMDLTTVIAHRKAHLTAYQDAALADRYAALVERVQGAEQALGPGYVGLALAVAQVYAKLQSYKDEYEVARLLTQDLFREQLAQTFSGDYKLKFHLAPPLLSRRDPSTGRLRKKEFGSWILRVFAMLVPLRRLRGTVFDVFGYSAHRRLERALIGEYEQLVEWLLPRLTRANHAAAITVALCYDRVRGYDVIKEFNITRMRERLESAKTAFERAADPGSGSAAMAAELSRSSNT